MKFNCGPTRKEKNEAHKKKLEEWCAYYRDWHDVFAWFPIQVGSSDCRWLEVVQCRRPHCSVGDWAGNYRLFGLNENVEYRAKESKE